MTWSNVRFNFWRSFVTMATNLPFCFPIFRTTPDVSSKLYFVEICYVSEMLWLFYHKRADFWLPNFGFKRSLLSLLNKIHILRLQITTPNKEASVDKSQRNLT